jgi:hypothetical protein
LEKLDCCFCLETRATTENKTQPYCYQRQYLRSLPICKRYVVAFTKLIELRMSESVLLPQ